jgi:hypothetical protein
LLPCIISSPTHALITACAAAAAAAAAAWTPFRYLGLHLAEVKARAEDSWFGKHGKFAWMNKTQLCPIIWLLILGLLLLFVTKVCTLCALDEGGPRL